MLFQGVTKFTIEIRFESLLQFNLNLKFHEILNSSSNANFYDFLFCNFKLLMYITEAEKVEL